MKRRLVRAFPFVAFALAACGGQSCSCMQPIKGGFPADERRHENALQVRVTQGGLDYLGQNGQALVGALLPNGSKFDIPASCGGSNEVCCLNGKPQTCTLDIDVQSFGLSPMPPDALAATVKTGLKSEAPIPISINQLGITAQCFFGIDTSKFAQAPYVELDPTITFAVDPTTHLTSLAVTAKVSNLDQSMLDITPQPGFTNVLACGLANVGFIKGFIIGQLTTTLQDQVGSGVEGALCSKCTDKSDCNGFADACTGGKCQRMGKCLQEIGASGQLDLGKMFASLSPSTSAKMDLLSVLGAYAEVTADPAGGLSLGVTGGGYGDPHNPCVPMRPAPMAPTVAKWQEETGEVDPLGMKPYHLALGVHQSQLDTMGWAAFDAGALCLDIGTPSVALLTSKTVGVLIPSLSDLIPSGTAPMYLVMRPQQEPSFTIGDGTFDVDMNGKKTIKDPLLTIAMPNFAIDFYAFFDDRYVRIMTLTADIAMPLSLDVDDKGQLVPLLGDLTKAFSNLRVTNSALLSESPDKLAKAFPSLLGIAVGQVAGNLKPIALPTTMGIGLDVVAIEPTDNKTFVTFFANLALSNPERFHAETMAAVAEVQAPPTEAFRVDSGLDPLVEPRVVLDLGGVGIDGGDRELEWSWSLDGSGLWSPYSADRRPTVRDPRLWLQGRHAIAVRARMAGQPSTTDPSPVVLEAIVDTVAPAGTFEVAGDEVRFHGSDAVSPPEALEYRVDAGAGFSPWSRADHAAQAGGFDPLAVKVEVRDEAGNVGRLDFHGRETTGGTSGGCGCAVGGRGSSSRGALALGVAALLLLGRRRRGFALVGALALGALAAAGCRHSESNPDMAPAPMLTQGDLEDPRDQVGRYSDAVARGGVIHVSAYDDANGDLAYTEVAVGDVGKPIAWQWVDGVPTDSPVTNPGGYRKGITDAGDDVGLYTSIALAGDGTPRIAYFDATNLQLKFAAANTARVFTVSAVEKPMAGQAGRFASLSLDGSDVPTIAYFSGDLPDGAGGFVSRLRLATATSAAPAGPADWTIVTLDETKIPCAGLCDKGQACVPVDPADKTKGSLCKAVDASPCPMACGTDQACIGAACVAYLPPPAAPDLPEGTGLFARLLRGGDGREVVYYDREQGDLKLARESGGTFAVSFIDGNDPLTDVGQFAAAALAPDGTLHVAYQDAIGDRLLYKTVQGATAEMAPEVVDDGLRADGQHPVGAGAAISADGSTVQVLYQDQQQAALMQAEKSGGAWGKPTTLRAGPKGYGFYPHVVSDGGTRYLTEFVYDRAAQTAGGNVGSLVIEAM